MVNAGRILIIPKGNWSNLANYEQLDLVTKGDIAYLARQASVGVDPSTDIQMTYWQPFGSAAKIADTSTPGLVMPDGTTIIIDTTTGLIQASLGISDLTDVVINNVADGSVLRYDLATQKWKNEVLGTAASRNATSSITSGSTDLIEAGAVHSLKQTLTPTILTQTLTAGSTSLTFTNAAIGNNSRISFQSDPFTKGLIDNAVQSGTTVTLTCKAQLSNVSVKLVIYND